jgi:hypothetical protein
MLDIKPINTLETPKYEEFPTEKVICVRAENCSYFKHICLTDQGDSQGFPALPLE